MKTECHLRVKLKATPQPFSIASPECGPEWSLLEAGLPGAVAVSTGWAGGLGAASSLVRSLLWDPERLLCS